jgi:hypothetical protein
MKDARLPSQQPRSTPRNQNGGAAYSPEAPSANGRACAGRRRTSGRATTRTQKHRAPERRQNREQSSARRRQDKEALHFGHRHDESRREQAGDDTRSEL